MKKIFICFFFLIHHLSFASYFLIEHNIDKIHITATFDQNEVQNNEGNISLYVPDVIWGTSYNKQITNIRSNGTYDPQTKSIGLNPGTDLRIEYDILCVDNEELINRFSDHYDHFISGERFYLMGIGLFITPPLYNDNITIQVKSNIPNVAFSTHPYFYQSNTMTTKLSELDRLIIVASNDMKYYYKDGVDIVMWTPDQALQDMFDSVAAPIFAKHEEFWQASSTNEPAHKLSIIIKAPISNIIRRFGGTVIGRTILFFIVPDNTSKDDLDHLVRHENTHFRIGKLLTGTEWFVEGFTEYYADKINLHFDQNWMKFTDLYNAKAADYFTSLAHYLDDKTADDYFFKISQIEHLPYTKGYVIAGQIDSIIDLDGVMRNLIQLCKQDKTYCKFTPETFFYAAGNVLTDEQQQKITSLITDVNNTTFTNYLLGKSTKLNYKQQKIPYFTADIQKVFKESIIWGKEINVGGGTRYNEAVYYKVLDSNFDFETGEGQVSVQNGNSQEVVKLPATTLQVNVPYYGMSLPQ
ncbi:hypothetical protein [Candidatus Phycorickettsia trachydisci]|nr:hypothetical protein [Candidatus Phycorickettsia trachydisci]